MSESFRDQLLTFAAVLDISPSVTPHLKRRAHEIARDAARRYSQARAPSGLPTHATPSERADALVPTSDVSELFGAVASTLGGKFGANIKRSEEEAYLAKVAAQLRRIAAACGGTGEETPAEKPHPLTRTIAALREWHGYADGQVTRLEPISVKMLAEITGVSKSEASKRLRRLTGGRGHQYYSIVCATYDECVAMLQRLDDATAIQPRFGQAQRGTDESARRGRLGKTFR